MKNTKRTNNYKFINNDYKLECCSYKKHIYKIISFLIPTSKLRKKARNILEFGLVNYIKIKNKEKKFHFENELSIVAIAKNEGIYFKEWIEYHMMIGVSKFYIYDNESDDNTKEVLVPYIEKGIVEYTYFPGQKKQMPAYIDCLSKHQYDTKWLAIIDLDEFIVPSKSISILDFLSNLNNKVGSIVLGWSTFGSNNHERKPEGLVIENYNKRGNDVEFYKSIINPRFVMFLSPHDSIIAGHFSIREDKKPIEAQEIRCHHYHCKSWEEYSMKAKRGDAYYGDNDGNNKYHRSTFDIHDKNEVYDPIMERFVEKLKARIQEK